MTIDTIDQVLMAPTDFADQYRGPIGAAASALRKSGVNRVLLLCSDSEVFAAGLLALLYAGVEIILPPNMQSGSLERLQGSCDTTFSDADIKMDENDELPPLNTSDAGMIFHSSGSSGSSKPIHRCINKLEDEVRALDDLFGLRIKGAAVYAMVPHYHLYGMTHKILWPMLSRRRIVGKTFNVWEDVLTELESGAMIVTGPAFLERLEGLAVLPRDRRPSFLISAGAPLSQRGADQAKKILGIPVTEFFGSTETGVIASRDRNEGAPLWSPLPGLKIESKEHQLIVNGEITADRVLMEPDGRFEFVGRSDRIVKIEAMRVNLSELEKSLVDLVEIKEAVTLTLDNKIGAVVALSSEGKDAFTTLGKFRFERKIRQELSKFHEEAALPRRWRFIDEIPSNAMGKRPQELLGQMFDDSLPHILSVQQGENQVELSLYISGDLVWFEGHFPDYPILPGVVQLDWAVKYARQYHTLAGTPPKSFKVKYQNVIEPDNVVGLTLSVDQKNSRLNFKFESDFGVHASGSYLLGGRVKIIAIIPTFNHHNKLPDVVAALQACDLPVLIVDDGSDAPTRDVISLIPDVSVIRNEVNQGKGAAVMLGLGEAHTLGYSHALQIDADGQHDLEAIPSLIAEANRQPSCLVSGAPVYDTDVPRLRKAGRWLTHFWVWIETLSLDIRDSMCGFRIYPIEPTMSVVQHHDLGRGMDFDIEILVRLHWRGVEISFVPVKVVYPEDNHSNFDILHDNIRISAAHTQLVFGMLVRLPRLLLKKARGIAHWSTIHERGAYWGLVLLAKSVNVIGYRVSYCMMVAVVFYFWLTGRRLRRASNAYLATVLGRQASWRESLRHFVSFGEKTLETFATWVGAGPRLHFDYSNAEGLKKFDDSSRGLILMVSHFGNVELLRANLDKNSRDRITLFVHTKHAVHFNRALKRFSPEANLNTVQVTEIGPETLIDLQDRIDRGEWIAIAGDRTPVTGDQRVVRVPFFDRLAPFPTGPYILASLLKCPIYHLTNAKNDDGVHVVLFDKIAERIKRVRGLENEEKLEEYAFRYAQLLESHCRAYPYLWYNFFDFWEQNR